LGRRARWLAALSSIAAQILSQCKILHAFPFYQPEINGLFSPDE